MEDLHPHFDTVDCITWPLFDSLFSWYDKRSSLWGAYQCMGSQLNAAWPHLWEMSIYVGLHALCLTLLACHLTVCQVKGAQSIVISSCIIWHQVFESIPEYSMLHLDGWIFATACFWPHESNIFSLHSSSVCGHFTSIMLTALLRAIFMSITLWIT